MRPSYYTQRRSARPAGRVAVPGRGDFYILRESSSYSLALDEGGLGKSFWKKVTSGVSRAVSGVASIATSAVKLSVVAFKTPITLTKGIVSGNVGQAFKTAEKDIRVAGGGPLKEATKIGKVVVPAVLAVIPGMQGVALAVSAAIVARDIYMAKKESREAKARMEGQITSAYGEYKQGVAGAGYLPVDENVFRAWVLSGGGGEMPIGNAVAQPGSDPGGQYATPGAGGTDMMPLLLLGGIGAFVLMQKRR